MGSRLCSLVCNRRSESGDAFDELLKAKEGSNCQIRSCNTNGVSVDAILLHAQMQSDHDQALTSAVLDTDSSSGPCLAIESLSNAGAASISSQVDHIESTTPQQNTSSSSISRASNIGKHAAQSAAKFAMGAGAGGLAAGGALGGSLGVLAAPFTLGLSVPIGAAIGSSIGAATGAATGTTLGLFTGGIKGYCQDINTDVNIARGCMVPTSSDTAAHKHQEPQQLLLDDGVEKSIVGA